MRKLQILLALVVLILSQACSQTNSKVPEKV